MIKNLNSIRVRLILIVDLHAVASFMHSRSNAHYIDWNRNHSSMDYFQGLILSSARVSSGNMFTLTKTQANIYLKIIDSDDT